MDYMEAFFAAEEKGLWWKRTRVETWEWADEQEGVDILLHTVPRKWITHPEKLESKICAARERKESQLWLEPELRCGLKGTAERKKRTGGTELYEKSLMICEPWLLQVWKAQPDCRFLTVILPDLRIEDDMVELEEELRFTERFLTEKWKSGGLTHLNGLALISRAANAGQKNLQERPFFQELYCETGLPGACVQEETEAELFIWRQMTKLENSELRKAELGKTGQRKGVPDCACMCLDFRSGYSIPYRILPSKCFYLDMTSESEKERLLFAKRKDIHYVGALNFLDTYVRKRYNMSRCKQE